MNLLQAQLYRQTIYRGKKTISDWRTALQMAESVDRPRRRRLLEVYQEIILDLHLESEMCKRIEQVTGANFNIVDAKTGEPDPERTDMLKKPWFFQLLKHAMESIFYGHSLVEPQAFEGFEISQVELINRFHLIPEKGMFLKHMTDEYGIKYREDQKQMDFLFEIGEKDNLGLLAKIVPYVLFKRFSTSAWQEFNELFVTPIRIGKTNVHDDESLNRMEDMLVNMAFGAYGIIGEDEELNFLQNNNPKAGESFNELIKHCKNEISVAINKSIIGQDSQGGSLAKEQVGMDLLDIVKRSDMLYISNYANFDWIPKLIKRGYPFKGYRFEWEKGKDIKQLWTMTQGLLQSGKNVSNEFIMDTFGIPVEDKPEPEPNPEPNEEGLDKKVEEEVEKRLSQMQQDFFL